MLTFPSACEGAGGDIHGVQHDLHRAMRIPQAVTTAWFATPPRPHADGGAKLLFDSIGHYEYSRTLALRLPGRTVANHTLKKASFSAPCTCTFPLSPTLHVYIGKYHTTKHIFLDTSSLCFSNSSINDSVHRCIREWTMREAYGCSWQWIVNDSDSH